MPAAASKQEAREAVAEKGVVLPQPQKITVDEISEKVMASQELKNIGVLLTGTDNKPMPNQNLVVSISGNGEVNRNPERTFIQTNESGKAYFDLKAGEKAGVMKTLIRYSDHGNDHVKAEIKTIITPGQPETIELFNNLQASPSGMKLLKPIHILVKDSFGNPTYDVPVDFVITMGDGMFENRSNKVTIRTNDAGEIAMPFFLGKTPGFNAVDIKVQNTQIQKTFQAVGQE